MSFSSEFKEILHITNAMMENVHDLHDSPFLTVKNPKVQK